MVMNHNIHFTQLKLTKYSKMEYFDISAWWLAWCISNQVKSLKWMKYSKMEYSCILAWWLAWCISNCYTRNLLSRNVNIFPVQCPIQEVSHFDCSSCNKVQYIPWWIETLVSTLIRNWLDVYPTTTRGISCHETSISFLFNVPIRKCHISIVVLVTKFNISLDELRL